MLKRLYLFPFLRSCFFYLLGHLIVAIYISVKKDNQTGVIEFVNTLLYIMAGVSPFIIFYLVDTFPKNIKWMINSYSSRKKLFFFHLYYQFIKTILVLLPIIFYSFNYSDQYKKLIIGAYSPIYIYNLLYITVPIFCIFIVTLFKIDKSTFSQQQIDLKKINPKRKLLRNLSYLGLFCITFIILTKLGDSFYLISTLFNVVIIACTVAMLSNAFNLWSAKKTNRVIYQTFFIYFIFNMLHLYCMRAIVVDEKEHHSKRLESMMYLYKFSPNLDKDTLTSLFKEVNPRQYTDFLSLNLKSLDIKFVIKHTLEKKELLSLLYALNDQEVILKQNDYLILLNELINSADKKVFTKSVINELHQTLIRNPFNSNEIIKVFLSSDNSLSEYIGLEIVRHQYDKAIWWKLLEPHKEKLNAKRVKKSFGGSVPSEYLEYLKGRSE